jgi:type II restriction/modification system DNA methylase subunit YeeA
MATNSELKKFAQSARRQLREQVAGRLEQVLGVDSVEVREKKNAVDQLKKQIAEHGKAEVIDRVAYTWFNRFCALRYMDANLYNPVRVVSPALGNVQPELLQEAKAGYLPEEWKKFVDAEKVFGLLNGSIKAENGQQEAYRRLLVGFCNAWSRMMPFMFEEIEDYTELLMPQDLLSENAVLTQTRLAMSDEACQDVEVIGWLYQYYISERKDEVFEQAKKGKKIEAEDIPAVTQLFTPHWIVRYLVENSLGRLWLLNHPDSKIIGQMDYYIKPVDEETDYLKVSSPEELKICDPACGSGHMLTYAFDLLYAIYEEQGYDPVKIPSLILEKNLYGIEIDERAGALAAFALAMKARGKDKRFFSRGVQPNVCVLEDVSFSDQELKEYTNAVGRDLFTGPLLQTLKQFEQARNFGSLIQPVLNNPAYIRQVLEEKNLAGSLFLYGIHEKVMKILKYSEYLFPRYQVVVANPPYMNSSGANDELKEFLQDNFADYKSDLFSAFIARNLALTIHKGQLGFMSPFVWMFISSYEKLRLLLLNSKTITSLIQLEYSGFDGAVVPICTFTIENINKAEYEGSYIRLSDFRGAENQSPRALEAIKDPTCKWLYRVSSRELKKISGCPIAYWLSTNARKPFEKGPFLSDIATTRVGMATGDNDRFVRMWTEVEFKKIGFNLSRDEAKKSKYKWFPYSNGGEAKKWYANYLDVVNWEDDGFILQTEKHESGRIRAHNFNLDKIFLPGLTWSLINSEYNAIRVLPKGFLFSSGAPSLFSNSEKDIDVINGYYNSAVSQYYLKAINPTLNNNSGDADKLPYIFSEEQKNKSRLIVQKLIEISKDDWNSYEISWNFKKNPLHIFYNLHEPLSASYKRLKNLIEQETSQMQDFEQQNNLTFISALGLQDEINSTIPVRKITLNANPYYRYGPGKTEDEYERLQRADTIKEFISYAVGCMFGRYSLDKPGLVLANQGETLQDYLRQVPDLTFLPDEDNVIPAIGGDWFQDDITERFKKFLKVTFGEEHYSENLQFIEEAIGRDIESYFLKDFYDYHVKMYKKRPIYWMFSSPKGTFNALIYMHRYNKDTISILLNDYLKQFRVKLESRKSYAEKLSISASGSQRERTIALKELETLKKQLEEITTYENKVIFPLATKQIEIDLDDGVKANYPKFGEALVPIKGLIDKTE